MLFSSSSLPIDVFDPSSSSSSSSHGGADDVEDDEYYLTLARLRYQHHPHSQGQSQTQHRTHTLPHILPVSVNASPGQGIRRLAESFLDSIDTDSPFTTGRGGSTHNNNNNNTQYHQQTQGGRVVVDNTALSLNTSIADLHPIHTSTALLSFPRKDGEQTDKRRNEVSSELFYQLAANVDAGHSPVHDTTAAARAALSSLSSSPPPSSSASSWATLHSEMLAFAQTCQHLQQQQAALRDELSARTRRAVKSVWPTAEVDLVGSVAAGVALPKSDLDFVVFFPVTHDYEQNPAFTCSAPLNADGHASLDAANINRNNSSIATTQHRLSEDSSSDLGGPSSSAHSGLVHHFAHAGSLIKLLGGRKKSKLLFRSTKIQVFKDINLIRLRDGCSGISMDLWFPTSSFITLRSQQHTHLISAYLTAFPHFYPLAMVIKSFMQQQMLNSGYSGLGSYGVLLMIVRFLQYHQQQYEQYLHVAESQGITHNVLDKEQNLGRLLCEFFRLYVTFDYTDKAIDVRGDGCFFPKPEMSSIQKKVKVHGGGVGGGQGGGGGFNMPPSGEGRGGGDDDEGEEGDSGDEDNNGHVSSSHSHHLVRPASSTSSGSANTSGDHSLYGDVDPSLFTAYTLVIQDPQDPNNFIICHHRALRNMIAAFMKALSILDPDTPVPQPANAFLLSSNSILNVAQPHTPSPPSASAAAAAVSALLNSQQQMGMYHLPPSATIGRTTSDVTYPSALLPASSLTSTNGSGRALHGVTRFQRLLDISAAYAGPAMKDCPSVSCRSLLNPTRCPIQNKVCFTCGYMFIKAGNANNKHHHHHHNHHSNNNMHNNSNGVHHQQQQQQQQLQLQHGSNRGHTGGKKRGTHTNSHMGISAARLGGGNGGGMIGQPNHHSHSSSFKRYPRPGSHTEPNSPDYGHTGTLYNNQQQQQQRSGFNGNRQTQSTGSSHHTNSYSSYAASSPPLSSSSLCSSAAAPSSLNLLSQQVGMLHLNGVNNSISTTQPQFTRAQTYSHQQQQQQHSSSSSSSSSSTNNSIGSNSSKVYKAQQQYDAALHAQTSSQQSSKFFQNQPQQSPSVLSRQQQAHTQQQQQHQSFTADLPYQPLSRGRAASANMQAISKRNGGNNQQQSVNGRGQESYIAQDLFSNSAILHSPKHPLQNNKNTSNNYPY